MTTQEIIEGNKLIAAFMGLTKSINGLTSEVRYVYDWKMKPQGDLIRELRYNSSWDWLMPVVEKIEHVELGKWYVHIQGNTVNVEDGNEGAGLWDFHINNDDPIMSLFPIDKTLKPIEAVWISCVEFIKWYNQNK